MTQRARASLWPLHPAAAAWAGPGLVSLLGAAGVACLGPAAAAAVGALVKPVPASHTSGGLQF